DTVRLTAGETLTTNKVVNAILFAGVSSGNVAATITPNNFTLGVTSGAILAMGNQTLTLSGGTVDFGPAEGLLQTNNANIVANSSLTGTGGLTVVEGTAGSVTLNAANSYTGTTSINANPVNLQFNVGNLSALGNGPVTLT